MTLRTPAFSFPLQKRTRKQEIKDSEKTVEGCHKPDFSWDLYGRRENKNGKNGFFERATHLMGSETTEDEPIEVRMEFS